MNEIECILAKLRQVEDKEVVCAAAVFSPFLFLKFILFCLLGEYFDSVWGKSCLVTGENEATDFGGTTDVGDMKATCWVPGDGTMNQLDNELGTETSTIVI